MDKEKLNCKPNVIKPDQNSLSGSKKSKDVRRLEQGEGRPAGAADRWRRNSEGRKSNTDRSAEGRINPSALLH